MNSLNKKTKQSSSKKIIITAIVAGLLLVASAGVYAYKAGMWPFPAKNTPTASTTDYNPPTKEQTTATGSTKQSSNPTESTGSDASPSPNPPKTTNEKPTVGMTITASNQSAGTFYIRTLVETISSSGTCSLSMTGPNGKSYSATAQSQANPSTSTCKGFDVPVGSLTSGTWHISITYEDASVQASASKDVTVQ